MKKNLRIVSAAAAALLAVAPVAAAGVSTVFAADLPVSVDGGNASTSSTAIALSLKVTNATSLVNNDLPSKATAAITTTTLPAGATVVPGKAKIYEVPAGSNTPSTTEATKFESGKNYVAKVSVSITGLKADTDYFVNGSTTATRSNGSGIIIDVPLTSTIFTISDSSLVGAPYVTYTENGTVKIADSGSVDLDSNSYSVTGVVNKIDHAQGGRYTVTTTAGNATHPATGSFLDLAQDVRDALKAAGVTVKADDTFDKPAASFTVNARLYATNGKTATFKVNVNPVPTEGDETFPQVVFNNHTDTPYYGTKTIDSIGDIGFNNVVPGTAVDVNAIKAAFTVHVSGHDATVMDPTVDISKVNTAVAGKYPVTVSATNADGKTTKVTFMLTVGKKGATYKTVQADGDIPVYQINGNTVTTTKDVAKNGDTIAVYGDPVKIGDKTYIRINSDTSDLYVESKYVDGSFKPADKVKKTVMHNAYIYDKDHKRVGTNMLRAYSTVEVIGAATKLADGSLVYQIGDNKFVMADNIDGTSRTLTHNAYVYKTSKKRADGRVLKAGTKVTTYGSPYTFKNGKAYYRIGGPKKQYVKVANF